MADFYSPIKGRIVEINNKLEDSPDSVNADPYDAGWFIRLDSLGEDRSALFSAEKYERLVR